MTNRSTAPIKLYLFVLSNTTLPLGNGKTMEFVLPCYMVETVDGKRYLIDTGIAPDYPRPADGPLARNEKNVMEHLAELGLQPKDIDGVICTHFDVDHAGYHDRFPHAEFYVQREHYDLARSGHERYKPARAHWDQPALHYNFIDGDAELFSGLTLLKTSGHAPGHQSVLVRLPQTGPVLLAIDAVMMQRLFTMKRKAWPKDDNEAELLASTKKLLDVVEREKVKLVVFGHDGEHWKSLKTSPAYYD